MSSLGTGQPEVWSGASYERIAATFAPIHERVVSRLGPQPDERFLDIGCGTGGAALIAARTGADVTGLDFSADQLEKARRAAADAGLEIGFDEGDCQEMPYAGGSFDVAASVFGLVFAPNHEQASSELARVVRTGGRVALTAWPNDEWTELGDRLGRPGPNAEDGRDWGNKEHVQELLGGSFELDFDQGRWAVSAESPEAVWELLSTSAPPLKAWLGTLDSERYGEVARAYMDFFGAGELRREYLLVLGRRR